MKLTKINIRNFIGAKDIEIEPTAPILVIAGDNGSGKSSTYEAVTLAATGEMARVKLKNQYGDIVTDGSKAGQIVVDFDEASASFEVPSGKWGEDKALTTPAVRYCLGAHRFAALDDTERRRFLFALTGTKLSKEEIAKRLARRDISEAVIAEALPMTANGLDAASKACAKNATERKGQWREVTGETWGASKAVGWKAALPDFNEDTFADASARLESVRAELATARTEQGRLSGLIEASARDRQQREIIAQRLAQRPALETKRDDIEDGLVDLRAKLATATAELNAVVAQIATAEEQKRQAQSAQPKAPQSTRASSAEGTPLDLLVDAIVPLREIVGIASDSVGIAGYHQNGATAEWAEFELVDAASDVIRRFDAAYPDYAPHADIQPPEPEEPVAGPSEAVDVDLAAVRQTAAKKVHTIDGQIQTAEKELRQIAAELGAMDAYAEQSSVNDAAAGEDTKLIAELSAKKELVQACEDRVTDLDIELRALKAQRDAAQAAKAKTTRARALHEEVIAWDNCAKALAPDGIPAEIVAEALEPLNTELTRIASQSGWSPVRIDAEMTITAGGRRYELLSESERWRADANIAAMIATISGFRFVMLDRIDVNSIPNRQNLLRWIALEVRNGTLDGALLLGTLKSPPTGLPPALFATSWIEAGRVADTTTLDRKAA